MASPAFLLAPKVLTGGKQDGCGLCQHGAQAGAARGVAKQIGAQWKAQCGGAKGRESFQEAEVSELRSQDGQGQVRVAKDTAKKPEGIQLERRPRPPGALGHRWVQHGLEKSPGLAGGTSQAGGNGRTAAVRKSGVTEA